MITISESKHPVCGVAGEGADFTVSTSLGCACALVGFMLYSRAKLLAAQSVAAQSSGMLTSLDRQSSLLLAAKQTQRLLQKVMTQSPWSSAPHAVTPRRGTPKRSAAEAREPKKVLAVSPV